MRVLFITAMLAVALMVGASALLMANDAIGAQKTPPSAPSKEFLRNLDRPPAQPRKPGEVYVRDLDLPDKDTPISLAAKQAASAPAPDEAARLIRYEAELGILAHLASQSEAHRKTAALLPHEWRRLHERTPGLAEFLASPRNASAETTWALREIKKLKGALEKSTILNLALSVIVLSLIIALGVRSRKTKKLTSQDISPPAIATPGSLKLFLYLGASVFLIILALFLLVLGFQAIGHRIRGDDILGLVSLSLLIGVTSSLGVVCFRKYRIALTQKLKNKGLIRQLPGWPRVRSRA